MSGTLRPFSFYSDGRLTGFDHDIGMELARRLGLAGAPVTGPFNTLLAGVQAGRFDAVVGSMTRTDQRAEAADFTADYYRSGARLWVADGSPVRGPADLSSATVGVALGSTFEQWARRQPFISDVRVYQSDLDALTDAQSGRIDAAVADQLVGANAVLDSGLRIRPAGPTLLDNSAAIPVRKGNVALRDALDEQLRAMRADGTYRSLFVRWFGDVAEVSAAPQDAPATPGGR